MLGWLQTAVERVREFAHALPERTPPHPRVGLALGGGFARGIAHLGVLKVFREHHIPINCIAGTSAGALLAIAYASGASIEDIERQAGATRFRNFGQWKLSRMGLATNERLAAYPRRFMRVSTFEELKTPLAIAATDLLSGDAVYFTRGLLGPALRASCAYPGLFVPVEYDGRLLVDGFLAAPVPVDALRLLGAEVTIAVYLESDSEQKPTSVADVIGRSFAIIQRHANLEWRSKADVVLEPQVSEFVWDDFQKTPRLVAAGEAAAREALPKIQALLAPPPREEVAVRRA